MTELEYYQWTTIINGCIFLLSIGMVMFMPKFVYGIQKKLFKISKQKFDIIVYGYLGLFKLFFIFFCLAPYIALLIVEH